MLNIRSLMPWSHGRDLSPGRQEFEHPVLGLEREMNRLFDIFWRGFDTPMSALSDIGQTLVSPRADISEDEKQIVVSVELPGMDEKDVEVMLGDDSLIISGEKKSEHEANEKGVRRMERSYGAFRRVLPIDTPILTDKVEASFKSGVLTIVLTKDPNAQATLRKIPVTGTASLEKPEEGKKKAA